ncbi:diacylglycerol kinase [Candidatus Woesebacteria bacterium CG22_combo_CG10-13_8_21_14_all_39_10]|uniref:Diacylglycerol kinase n=4 Tax=Candidatus Woeseibacteriota TaxID=1752722 RepID=A0A2M7XAB4_9BACT|nr:MAG: diacylglycerol kinase [Candidatus Woesebacteria bacterium CG22_combo_CG10-13_8_21_14_all_39_10]PIU71801.1 MAG: diacylglycerol kinase [Candidatus Woesebacteria bacterium CG06_land_8_20_14_3_00_39_27]PJA43117.1 MAG: diacylglycerol kinase [Candidatus Woesebacteria bacterium CG_4_9_14_3_um_filter_39_10]
MRHIVKSFKFAADGIKEAFQSEKNMKVHSLLMVLAIALGIVLKLSSVEWAILTITIGLVLISEFINTSLEQIVDLVSPEKQEKAKIAKDVAAAGVLVSAIVAVLIGALLFLPKFF